MKEYDYGAKDCFRCTHKVCVEQTDQKWDEKCRDMDTVKCHRKCSKFAVNEFAFPDWEHKLAKGTRIYGSHWVRFPHAVYHRFLMSKTRVYDPAEAELFLVPAFSGGWAKCPDAQKMRKIMELQNPEL